MTIYWKQAVEGWLMNLDEVRKIYNNWAPFYNPTHSWSLPKRRAARLMLNVQPGNRVLDLACGTGANIPHLRKLVGNEGHVIGVDLSPRMLDVARDMVAKHGWKNVEVVESDAAHLPFTDKFFDKVICSYALTIIPDYIRAIEEIKRVLVPGGSFVSLEVKVGQSTSHSLLQWLMPICAVDLSHETLQKIKTTFTDVQTRHYWQGMITIATATKP